MKPSKRIVLSVVFCSLTGGLFSMERPPGQERTPNIPLMDYLLASPFDGVQLDGPSPREPLRRSFLNLKSTGKAVRLKFFRRKSGHGNPGFHSLTIGKNRFEGEWNITGSMVHLWIDKVNGLPVKPGTEPMEIYFRAPRVVDDPFVIMDFQGDLPKPKVRGLFLMRVRDDRYWKSPHGGWSMPSRTEVMLSNRDW